MRRYAVTLTGKTPLLMHQDNIEWADFMDEWKANPDNKRTSKAGDDRTPSWRWLGSVYNDEKTIGIPAANIMRCVMEGGAMVPVPGGKMGKTFKSQTQSGMMSEGQMWELIIGGKAAPSWAECSALMKVPKFADHKTAVKAMGFDLLVKRAKIGQQKHIRVRPQFTSWEARGAFLVWDDQIDEKALALILEYAGQYKGLCDWRPGGRTPGPYGTFEAKIG